MLESIIRKLYNYINDVCGLSRDEIVQTCNLDLYEIDRLTDIMEDDGYYEDMI